MRHMFWMGWMMLGYYITRDYVRQGTTASMQLQGTTASLLLHYITTVSLLPHSPQLWQ